MDFSPKIVVDVFVILDDTRVRVLIESGNRVVVVYSIKANSLRLVVAKVVLIFFMGRMLRESSI